METGSCEDVVEFEPSHEEVLIPCDPRPHAETRTQTHRGTV